MTSTPLDTEFQLANKLMRCEAKDPELNVALHRRESGKAAASKDVSLSRPLVQLGKGTEAGGSTGSSSQGEWASRPAIADEHGRTMDRGGEEALKRMELQAHERLQVERLGKQMKELFTNLTLKQEEDNRKLREENAAIRRQMLELEKLVQNNRMEQLMTSPL